MIEMKLLLVCVLLIGATQCDFTSGDESDDIAYHAFEIYRKIYDSSENLVFSPLSFRVLYSILYQSSFGQTETELRTQLFANIDEADKKRIQSTQSAALNRILASSNIKLANKVYVAEGATLRPDFKTLVAEYKSEVEQVNFGKGTEVANKINQWVEEQTNHLIKNLIEADSITPDAALFLINTLYFKAQWLSPFAKYALSTGTFNNMDGSKSEIEFIYDADHYSAANNEALRVDVLQLPYEANSNFILWIIVPREGSSLDELKTKLNRDFMHKINASLAFEYTRISFPTFTIESDVDGRKISQILFHKSELNMLENSQPLRVDEIKQKTKIIVNTDGTEAASSTYAKVVAVSAIIGRTKIFTADRPFLFAVLTADKLEPMFVGHYVNANK